VRILLVEDEPRLAETIRRGLVAEGFVVEVIHDGLVGFEAAVGGGFDVLVLDIMLPGKSGYDIVRDLRNAEVWTPVLMLSAKDGEYDLADAFDLGADDYLIKPFSFVVLIARLRALLRRGAPQRPTVLTVGDLVLDPARHQVTRGGVEVEVTPTMRATTTSSRSTSGTCAANWTYRSARTPFTRCAVLVTDWHRRICSCRGWPVTSR
jgi:two-component system, OmpR family, response regulator